MTAGKSGRKQIKPQILNFMFRVIFVIQMFLSTKRFPKHFHQRKKITPSRQFLKNIQQK